MPIESSQREPSSTYFVQDRSNLEEMSRLDLQDKLFTNGMGGVLPELADSMQLRRVLDVGCGTGGWLIETAKTYPSIEKLVGIDISGKVLAYARTQAEAAALGKRVQFQEMDALGVLGFGDASFDLVNQRFGISWLRTWEWRKILWEYQRVTRPGGIIRIAEGNTHPESNSPALKKLCDIILKTFYNSGRLFRESTDGITYELAHLMTQYGIADVESCVHTLDYGAGTENWQYFYEDMLHIFRITLPFMQKWTHVPVDYEDICQQALKEMQQPDFVATGTVLTCWGRTPMNESIMRRL